MTINPSSILVIRLSSIGDIVLTADFFSGLRNLYYDARITWLVKKEYSEILSFHPAINKIIEWDKKKEPFFKLINRLKKERFDTVIDLHDTLRTKILCLFFKILKSKIIKVKKYHLERLLLVLFKIKPKGKAMLSVKERYNELLKSLGLKDQKKIKGLNIPSYFIKKTLKILPENFKGYITICDEATAQTKRWDKFYELIETLLHLKEKVVLIGKDRTEIYSSLEKKFLKNFINLTARTSIMESAAIIKESKALVCNDTGMMHIGDALKIKTVSIWGPTVKEFGFYPQSKTSIVIEISNLKCRPCSLHGSKVCPLGHFKCMRDIPVSDVLNALNLSY